MTPAEAKKMREDAGVRAIEIAVEAECAAATVRSFEGGLRGSLEEIDVHQNALVLVRGPRGAKEPL